MTSLFSPFSIIIRMMNHESDRYFDSIVLEWSNGQVTTLGSCNGGSCSSYCQNNWQLCYFSVNQIVNMNGYTVQMMEMVRPGRGFMMERGNKTCAFMIAGHKRRRRSSPVPGCHRLQPRVTLLHSDSGIRRHDPNAATPKFRLHSGKQRLSILFNPMV